MFLCLYYSYRSLEQHSVCVRHRPGQTTEKDGESRHEEEEDTPQPEVHNGYVEV